MDKIQEYNSLQTIIYCVAKHGEYDFSDNCTKAMCIAECKSFDELKYILTIFACAKNDVVSEDTLSSSACYLDVKFPELDRLLRWPWHKDYES